MKKRIKALEIKLKTTKVKPKRIELINELAWELRRLDPKRGLKLSREARKLSEKTNSKNGLACALRNIGACNTWISEYKIALNSSLEALNLFEELHDPANCAKTLFTIGTIFYYIADYDSALRYHLQSLKINEDIKNLDGQANSLNGVGLVYNVMGNNDKALENLLQSLKIAVDIDNQDIQARVLESLATYYNHLKQYEQASSYALRCVNVNKKIGDKRTQSYALNTLGKSNQYLGEYDMAIEFYQLSLNLRKEIDYKSGQAITLINIGNLHLLQGDTQEALTYLKKALMIAEKIKSNDINYKVNKALSEVYEKTGNITEFIKHFKAQHKAKDSISVQKSIEKSKGIELQFEMKQIEKEKEILEKSYKNIQILSDIGQQITSVLNLEEILNTIYERVNELMDATVFGIGLYKPKEHCIEYRLAIEKGKRYKPYTRDTRDKNQLAVWCINNKKPVLINNVYEEYNKYIKEHDSLRPKLEDETVSEDPVSIIYLPILVKNKVIGIITVQSFKKNSYDDNDMEMLNSIASYAAIALENARLYENMEDEVKQRTKEVMKQKEQIEKTYQNIKLLSEIGQDITATLSIDTIIEKVYKNVNSLMDASIFCIGIYNEQANEIYFQGAIEKNEKLPRFSYSLDKDHNKPAVWCVKNKKEVFINDRSKEYKKYASTLPAITVGETPESLIYLPLYSKEKPIGVITVQSFKKNAYSKYHLNILRNLAVYSAIALENAHLYENMEDEVKQRTKEVVKQKEQIEKTYQNIKLLSEIGQEITATLSIETIIEKVYKNVNSLMDASSFGIGIYNNKKNEIYFACTIEKNKKLPQYSIKLGDSNKLAAWCFKNQKEVFINDYKEDYQRYISKIKPPSAGILPESIIYLPLLAKEKTIGVITVQSFKKNAFSLYHLNILQNLAIYIAIALENAGLYENLENKVKERTAELSEANVELEKLSLVAKKTDNYVIITDKDDLIEWVNEGFSRIMGYQLNEVIGKTPREILRGEFTDPETAKRIDKLAKKKQPFTAEILNYTKNGEFIWLNTNVTPILNKNGKIIRYISVGSDITRRVEAEKEIKKQRDNILDSINYASRIQEAMLPPIKTVKRFLPNSFIFYRPKDIVSGDFYWFSHRNGKSLIATVDCTGHGVPGALMAMIGNSLLNEIVNEKLITDPAAILNQLHSSLKTTLQQKGKNAHPRDGMDIAICSIDKNKKTIRYAGAVCPLFVVNNHSVEIIKANIYSIGEKSVMPKMNTEPKYTNQDIPVQKNMNIYMCSDGFIDQYGGERKQKFGTPRFKQLLLDICGLDMRQQKASLSQAMEEWKKSNKQIDDMLVMGIKF